MWTAVYDFCRDQGSIIAGVLALIAGMAVVCISLRQLKEFKRSIDISAAVDLPKVFFQNAVLDKRDGANLAAGLQYPGVKITFVNYGRTPAFLTQCCVQFSEGKLPDKPIYNEVIDMNFGKAIESGATYDVKHVHGHDFSPGAIPQIINGKTELWLYGFIAYKDFLNRVHKVGFCLRLDCFPAQERAEFAVGHGPVKYTYAPEDRMSIK